MNCDECEQQVFELIEREAAEPEQVREILERCPECRALFDEMKAALADAMQLPIEEPPAHIDVAILQAARERSPKLARRRPKAYRAPQWAVAAAALLAIGIGLWAIPREEGVVMEDAPELVNDAEHRQPMALEEHAAERSAPDEVAGNVELDELAESAPAPAVAKSAPPASRRGVAPRRKESRRDSPAAIAADDVSAGARAPSAGASLEMATADAEAMRASVKDEKKAASLECQARLAALERAQSKGDQGEVDAEDALAIGRCYQAAGNVEEARRWLSRAASDPKTRRRATRALKELPAP